MWKGIAAGLGGGLAAAWVMNRYQSSWNSGGGGGGGDSAPARVAEALLPRPLAPRQKECAATVVHYAFGAVVGGVYGAAAEKFPQVRAGMGLAYGAAVWLEADELMVPALGLSGPITQYPWKTHVYALSSHLVYGAALEASRRAIRALL